MSCIRHILAMSLALLIAASGAAFADYGTWTDGGVLITDASALGANLVITNDGSGGAIAAWWDMRLGYPNGRVYARRVNSEGVPQWAANGIQVSTDNLLAYRPGIAGDGTGGAVISWYERWINEYPLYHKIMCRKLDSAGNSQFVVELAYVSGSNVYMATAPDCGGGAFIAWSDSTVDILGEPIWDLWLAHVSSGGAVLFSVKIAEGTLSDNPSIALIPDNNCGEVTVGPIIAWTDDRNFALNNIDVYAQKIGVGGVKQWDSAGVPVFATTAADSKPRMASDDLFGAFVACRSGSYPSVQRINGNGTLAWASGGIALRSSYAQGDPAMISDGENGIIVTWADWETYSEWDWNILAQRISYDGDFLWNSAGVLVCGDASEQDAPWIVSDADGGALISWIDYRTGNQVYGMRLDPNGDRKWATDGILFDGTRQALARDGVTGEVWTWTSAEGIRVQRIDRCFDFEAPTCVADYKYVNVQSGNRVYRSFMNGCPSGDLEKLVVDLTFAVGDLPRDIEASELILEKPPTGFTYWSDGDIIADGPARIKDAVGGNVTTSITQLYFSRNYPLNNYTVVGYDDPVYFHGAVLASEIVSVKSPDYTGDGTVNSTDYYYLNLTMNKRRGQTGYNAWFDFTNDNYVSSADKAIMDTHNGHQKPAGYQGLMLLAEFAEAAENVPMATMLSGNYPNPFNPATTIEFALAHESPVNLSIYNVKGEMVRTLVNGTRAADSYRITWDGKNNNGVSVPSGIYFYRLKAGEFDQSRKMVLLR